MTGWPGKEETLRRADVIFQRRHALVPAFDIHQWIHGVIWFWILRPMLALASAIFAPGGVLGSTSRGPAKCPAVPASRHC